MRSRVLTSIFATASLLLAGCAGSGTSALTGALPFARHGSGSSPIQHVVIIVQENRSFDNFFALFPKANGATRGKEMVKKKGKFVDKWVKLKPHSLIMTSDIQHCHKAFLTAYDGGKMDGFNLEYRGVCPNGTKPAGTLVYQYVQESDIAPYWDIAEAWTLADAMFQTQGSGSFTAHQDLIRGGTCISSGNSCNVGSPSANTESLVDNPTGMPWGCDAPKNTTTSLIDAYGTIVKTGPFPCSNDFPDYGSSPGYNTLADLLDAKGVSWKYYSPCFIGSPGSCGSNGCKTCSGALLNAFDVIDSVRYGPEWGTNVSMPETNIFADIDANALPAVSWVIPEDDADDHPGESVDNGPSWVASVVNAIGQSSYWNSSAVIVIWDDWGGMYDNAKPPFQDGWGGLGFRVPMMVVSPYAIPGSSSQGGSISHTQYEFASILRYIEDNWNLGRLGTSDTRATSIGDIFNYNQSPRSFTAIPSLYTKEYFINRPHPPQHGDPQ
ncbi:MAG TPA: alkaline phosphatase family protein [Candidatus Binatia bacterium]|nr:alkaline phosphatase family protein [Candidatus Binatia bacterium]